jgi:pyruvate/2-oxoglutarate dehydrogenase complex dihydrolipoamide acyltransferase (E2) component
VTVAPVPEPSPVPVLEDVTVDAVTVDATSPAETVPAPLKPAKKRHADPGHGTKPTKRKFSGSTSDHLRVPEVPEVTSSQRSALDHLFENDADSAKPKAKAKAATSDAPKAKAPKAPKPVDLMSGKPVDLEARVPKALRKAARDEAHQRGLDVDTVVTDLLFAWLTEHR